mgnify:FL=1
MEEKREKQFWRIICCLLPLCLFLVWVNILPVSAQTQLSASAQIQSAAPWGTETVKETRAYYDGAYWRVPAGWYHYQPTKDVWKDLSVSNSEDYFTDYYVAVWKKADGGYELAGQIGDVAHQAQGSTSVSICWNKDVDYYIQIVSDSKETFRLDVSWTLEITIPEVPSDVTVSGADGKTEVSVSGKEELKWIQYTVPEDGRYKIRFADAKNMARVDIYKLRDGRLTDLGGLVLDFNRNYQDFKKGDILYVRCTSWQDATSYELSIKKTEEHYYEENKEHAGTVRSNTKASTVANAQAQAVIEYLNAVYKNTDRGLYVGHMDQTDKNVLKKLAQKITEGCTTETQKADAIVRWVGRNIKYDTSASSYSPQVFYTRTGDCYGDTMLIADLARLCGLRAAVAEGWKADLTRWTIEELSDITGHAWNYIYADGQWRMYDGLWGNYNMTDPSAVAAKGYYSSGVEGIYLIGKGVDSSFASISLDAWAQVYQNGEWLLLQYGMPINAYKRAYWTDDDGEFIREDETGVGWSSIWADDRFYPVFAEGYQEDINGQLLRKTSGQYYKDGRPRPENSRLYINGWFGYPPEEGEEDPVWDSYAGKDGVLYNCTIENIDGTMYYFAQNGHAFRLNMSPDQYSMTGRLLTVPTGISGQILADRSIQKYAIHKNENARIVFRDYDSSLVDVSEDGTITTKQEGYVTIYYDVVSTDGRYYVSNRSIEFLITNKAKPTPDYADRPVDNSSFDADDSKGNADNSDGTEKVIAPKTYELSKEQYVYNGKVKTPEVRIYGKHGDQLPDTAFTVEKASGRKNVGTYAYKITFRGAYKKYGIKTLTFKILPKGTNLTKVGRAKKALTVKWKKQTAKMPENRINGYQIRYSLKSSMKQSKMVRVKGYKKSSAKIRKLQAKKKYYLQIRTYMTVGKKTYYSKWSAKKNAITK